MHGLGGKRVPLLDVELELEEVKFLQKQRERKSEIPALTTALQSGAAVGGGGGGGGGGLTKVSEENDGDAEKDDWISKIPSLKKPLFWLKIPIYQVDNELKRAEDELYTILEHLKVKKQNSEESSSQWTTGIAEIQLPIEYKLKNIVEIEAAKKLLQEKRLMGRDYAEIISSSYSADYFQHGRDYAEKLRREPM